MTSVLQVGSIYPQGHHLCQWQTQRIKFMEEGNQTEMVLFHFRPFSKLPEVQMLIFVLFLMMYLVSIGGNMSIVLTIWTNRCLHTPMYFFLVNLAVVDILCTSTILPKLLDTMVGGRTISYGGCMAQLFFFTWSLGAELLLFSAMAYDRFVAICHPLHYTTSITPRLCGFLVTASWASAFANALTHTVLLTRLLFCGHNQVPHFFCDLSPLLKLACSDTSLNDIMVYTVGALPIITPFVGILTSYTRIFTAVLRIPSTGGKWKAFSTCGSHLTVVTVYYVPCIFIYLRAGSKSPFDGAVAVFYTVVTPLLNPLIYTLRNQEVKSALKRLRAGRRDVDGEK